VASACALFITGPVSAAVTLPDKSTLEKVDFERHIMGLFGKMGCNSGSCHGSFQGKGGFRLSLFGYDPEKDYAALTREALGRRINSADPDQSLILLKATGQIKHDGGVRFSKGSWQYEIFRDWIVRGAPWQKGSGEVASVILNPPEYAFTKPDQTGQLKVRARFADGSEENITPFCDYRINDDAIGEVSALGEISARQGGDTAVIVSYRGQVLPVRVLVPLEPKAGFAYPKVPEVNYIDREVFAKLKRLNIVPSDLAGDAEFLRRVTIDTIGSLPTPDEVREFLADKDPNKRAKKIDALLAHPMHGALWATKFCDITGNNTDLLEQPQNVRQKRSQMWHDWFRKRIAENMPYDQIVEGVLTATSREGMSVEQWLEQTKAFDDQAMKEFGAPYAERKTLDLYWRRQQQVAIDQWGQKTAAAFLGVRIECAECHKHPFDRWTQVDYRSYANVFSQVGVGASPEARQEIDSTNKQRNPGKKGGNKQVPLIREVYVGSMSSTGKGKGTPNRPLTHPETNEALPAKALGGPEIPTEAGKDPRVALMNWLRSPDNQFFARSFVNRIWGHYFGTGIVDPVDNFSLANPPSNDQLLNALAKDFIEHKFDVRYLERTVLLSRTYQLSSDTNETNKLDKNNYSHSYVRPLMAEVVVDVLNSGLGTTENFGADAPPNSRAIEVGSTRVNNQTLNYAFRIFGRSPRTLACDCERSMEPALPQKLFLMTDQNVLNKLRNSRLKDLLASKKTDEEILDELFLATLTRNANEKEKKRFAEYREVQTNRESAFVDTLWALINTREFILNH
jgi:hypothetical protein